MKKHYLLLNIVLFVFFSCTKTIAQNFENPGTYMDFIGKQHQLVAKRFLAYNSALSHSKNSKKAEGQKVKLMDAIQECRMNISGMPSYQNDKSYRDSAVSFMKLYYNALNEDYSKIVNMEEIAEQSYDLMEAYLLAKELVDKKMDEASEELQNEGKKFAAAHNVTLTTTEDDIDKMMNQVGETSKYYTPVYLIFFKSFKQEAYMIDAIDKKNINGIEQNRNSLLQFSQDGLMKLSKISSFKGDNSLVTNCKRLLEFYVKEAADKVPSISDYILKQEAFDKMQKEFDKKSEPTKEEVNTFNKAVKEVNSSAKTYSSNTNSLNQSREDLLNNWNNTVDVYFDTHMPTYN